MQRRQPVPTVHQTLADLQAHSISLRDAHRLIRAYMRAAARRRVAQPSKELKP